MKCGASIKDVGNLEGGGVTNGSKLQMDITKKLPIWGRGVSKIQKNCRRHLWMVPEVLKIKSKPLWKYKAFWVSIKMISYIYARRQKRGLFEPSGPADFRNCTVWTVNDVLSRSTPFFSQSTLYVLILAINRCSTNILFQSYVIS